MWYLILSTQCLQLLSGEVFDRHSHNSGVFGYEYLLLYQADGYLVVLDQRIFEIGQRSFSLQLKFVNSNVLAFAGTLNLGKSFIKLFGHLLYLEFVLVELCVYTSLLTVGLQKSIGYQVIRFINPRFKLSNKFFLDLLSTNLKIAQLVLDNEESLICLQLIFQLHLVTGSDVINDFGHGLNYADRNIIPGLRILI